MPLTSLSKAQIRFRLEQARLRRRLRHIAMTSQKPSRFWRRVFLHQQKETGLMFRHLRHGGTRRGVTWPWFSDQYTRKTDGVNVPAVGGVPLLRGEGTVQARRRPSGALVDESSNLLRDTGLLASAAASVIRVIRGGTVAEIHTPIRYAEAQQDRRPFTFFTRGDARLYRRWAAQELLNETS